MCGLVYGWLFSVAPAGGSGSVSSGGKYIHRTSVDKIHSRCLGIHSTYSVDDN